MTNRMERSAVIVGLLAAGVAVALIISIGGFVILAENQSNSNLEHDEEMKSVISEMKEMKTTMNTMSERMDMMIERMDVMMDGMDMMFGIMTGDMMPGDMMGTMDMSNEPLDVIIKLESSDKVLVGKEAEILLLVLNKETEEPLEGLQVVIGIERGPSMGTMDMMGPMFDAEDKGAGEYIVRFTPDSEGDYIIHTMVSLPFRAMMDNHIDFLIIAEISEV
ncbi:MAG: hypothetical protein ACE5J2_06745 [Nitrososphaerales archaeon]